MSMDHEPPREVGRWLRRYAVWTGAALVLLVVGAAAGVMWSERHAGSGRATSATTPRAAEPSNAPPGGTAMPGMSGTAPTGPAAGARGDEPVEISLTPEAVQRAGIKTAQVTSETAVAGVTLPGTVMSNAYGDTKVTALVGGIVRQVSVELGSPVERGQPLAVIFSIELAEAQMKYLSMQAMLEADHQKRQRTEKLVALGAASRQELEEIVAVHSSHETELAAVGQRLLLLGLSLDTVAKLRSASQVVSEVAVPAPAVGVVTARNVNPGQVVSAGQDLFVVTDLSTVWVIGDLYEKDFAAVRVGSEASITVPSAPKSLLRGRVAYIDPRVDPVTRTAKVRVEVPNRNGQLRFGMYVTLSFQTASGQRLTLVPRSAVQSIGERTVVYVPAAGEEGKFSERPVKLGPAVGDFLQVLEGLKPGDRVVTDGSFFLRAEATRTGG
jgi:RND family efflux transporter MFP subunit